MLGQESTRGVRPNTFHHVSPQGAERHLLEETSHHTRLALELQLTVKMKSVTDVTECRQSFNMKGLKNQTLETTCSRDTDVLSQSEDSQNERPASIRWIHQFSNSGRPNTW